MYGTVWRGMTTKPRRYVATQFNLVVVLTIGSTNPECQKLAYHYLSTYLAGMIKPAFVGIASVSHSGEQLQGHCSSCVRGGVSCGVCGCGIYEVCIYLVALSQRGIASGQVASQRHAHGR